MSEYLLLLVPKEPVLTGSQIKVLADIFVGLGNIGVGSVIVPALFDKLSVFFVVSGLLVALCSWAAAIFISKRI